MEQQIVQICWGFRIAKSGRLAPLNLAPNVDGSGPRRACRGDLLPAFIVGSHPRRMEEDAN
jgi:hypothetical protein